MLRACLPARHLGLSLHHSLKTCLPSLPAMLAVRRFQVGRRRFFCSLVVWFRYVGMMLKKSSGGLLVQEANTIPGPQYPARESADGRPCRVINFLPFFRPSPVSHDRPLEGRPSMILHSRPLHDDPHVRFFDMQELVRTISSSLRLNVFGPSPKKRNKLSQNSI